METNVANSCCLFDENAFRPVDRFEYSARFQVSAPSSPSLHFARIATVPGRLYPDM